MQHHEASTMVFECKHSKGVAIDLSWCYQQNHSGPFSTQLNSTIEPAVGNQRACSKREWLPRIWLHHQPW